VVPGDYDLYPGVFDEDGGVAGGGAHLGPFATIRRGNEVANYARSLGYSASAPYHNGDGYYVDVW
jgi:hypothetical protein